MAPATPTAADPMRSIRLIVTRLAILIAIFYAMLSATMALLAAPYETNRPTLLHVFDPSLPSLSLADFGGVMGTMAYLLVAVLISPCVWKLAKRSVQCADFAVSVYVVHFLLTWYVDERGIPKDGAFYGVLVLCGVVSSVLSERLAMREEMAEIPLDRFVASKGKQGGMAGMAGRGDRGDSHTPDVRIEMV